MFSPDRSRVVNSCSAPNNGDDAAYINRGRAEVSIWEVRSGRKLSPNLFIGTSDCLYAGFSPDGSRLVTTSIERMARVWDGFTGKLISPVLPHGHEVYHASFSPDSRLVVTASRDGTVRLWEADTGEPVGPPLDHRFWKTIDSLVPVPVRVFFSPDGRRLVSCNRDGRTHVWALPSESPPVADDLLLAELLANAIIDETGTLTLLDLNRTRLASDWRRLLTQYPSTLGVSPQQVSLWNQRRASEYFRLGRAKLSSRQFVEAIADFSCVIALDPHYDKAYYERGDIFKYLHEYEKAVADFQTEIEICPESASGYMALAGLYANGPSALRNPEKALPLALKAVELSRGHVDDVRNLGMVYYRLGQWDKAVETLEKCATASGLGGTAYDFFFLAMTYARLGQLARAEECYAKGIESWKNAPAWFSPRYEQSMQRYSAEAQAEIQKLKSTQQLRGGP
jgi:tetratricopeptide (TPR) repeat protein